MIVAVILIIIGFFLLIKGADFLVEGSCNVAKRFHIPEIVIGLTVVSIGTSMPELLVSITSAINGHSDMSIGNVIGSNISNLFLILGLSAAIHPINVKKETISREIPICLGVSILFTIMCNIGLSVSKIDGIILIILFVAFIVYNISMTLKEEKLYKNESKEKFKIMNIVFILFGIILLKFGGDLVVNNAVIIAEKFNLSEKIISVTILAIGTSLPELVTSVSAAMKGKSDIAIGNILGSNIFNILLIIGVSAFLAPISYNISYNKDMIILIGGTIILSIFPIIPPKNKMNRNNGIVFLCCYLAYMYTIFNS